MQNQKISKWYAALIACIAVSLLYVSLNYKGTGLIYEYFFGHGKPISASTEAILCILFAFISLAAKFVFLSLIPVFFVYAAADMKIGRLHADYEDSLGRSREISRVKQIRIYHVTLLAACAAGLAFVEVLARYYEASWMIYVSILIWSGLLSVIAYNWLMAYASRVK